jgi:ubiquinone/menaquinone biosynthesis C-methylase UbiE
MTETARTSRTKDSFAAAFDRLAADYDSWYQTPLGARSSALEMEAVLSLAEPKPGEVALDVSCGTGNYAIALAERGVKVAALDSSDRMLQIARSKAARKELAIDWRSGAAEDLPFASDSLDLVTAVLMLEFTRSPQEVVHEMLRVVKPGGRLVIGALGKYNLWAAARRLKSFLAPSIWSAATFFSRRQLTRFLVSAGAHSIEWKSAIYFPPVDNSWLLDGFQVFEGVGQRVFTDLGAFLAVRAEK